MRNINFNSFHVLDAWGENVTKNNNNIQFDYIRLDNGVLILITDEAITVYDADDLEVPGSAIVFHNITTRKRI